MYISELALHGFKSFAKKVKLQFGNGITAVVGPNGCGKTNIVDAIRWVLGEQKYRMLRGSRMEDIIFNGSDAKKPLNVCEVSMVVHNDKGELPVEYTDVEITRRAFRNGESEYMINRTPCRLKDIRNLFVDTGMGADAYSVIELKMIEDILSEHSDDRRRMFEEAAGINKYKHQRKSTFQKIEATRADLNRVNDIILEIGSQVHELRLQLKRYDRHAVLTEKLQNREAELAYVRKVKIEKKLKPYREKITELEQDLLNRGEEEKNRETELEQMQRAFQEQQAELNILQKKLDGLSQKREENNNRILVLTEQSRSTTHTIERLQIEKDESSKKIQSFNFNIKELEVEQEALDPKISGKRSEYSARKEDFRRIEEKFQEAEKKLEHLNTRHLEHLKDLNASRSLQERTEEMLDEKLSLLRQLESQAEELESEQGKLETTQKGLEGERKELENMISSDRNQLSVLDIEINKIRSQKHDLTLEFHRIANQVESLESQLQFYKEIIESKEGYPSGVRYILNKLKDYPGILGTVAELIEVKPRYSSAVSAALGPLASCLVCKTRNEALTIVDDLRREKKGKVTIIPLDTLNVEKQEKPVLPEVEGVLGFAVDLVKAEKKIRPVIHFLLQDILFILDSTVADVLWKTKGFSGSFADLSGRYFDRSGMVTSISSQDEVSLLGRKERMDHLDKKIDLLVKEGNASQEKTKKLDKELSECEDRHHHLSTQLGSHIDALVEIEKQITQNEYLISQKVELLQTITHQIVSTREDILNLEKSLDRFIPKMRVLEEQQVNFQDKIALTKAKLEDVKKQKEEENSFIQEIRFELINLENERDNLTFKIQAANESIKDLEQRKVELSDEVDQLNSRLKQLTSDSKTTEKSLQKLLAQYKKDVAIKDLKEQSFLEIQNQMNEMQREIRNQQKEREGKTEELNRIELQIVDSESQIDLLESRIHERYQWEIPDVLDVKLPEDDLSMEVERIERSIERIGPINMAVKGQFEEENSRLEFLLKQRTDLVESESSLLESMNRIDSVARKQFLETYDQIRKNYRRTFRLFFEGGDANLNLTGGNGDPLEGDITILAKPPGKHTHNLRALSSGEKALTAIALLFAIYQVKPSPFCILDEVDAPLDDSNISRFTTVLEKFAEETQFIIVTHNKLTMESARHLYGITMEQSGISKIVSVRFDKNES